jgi:hypothetical protein
LFEDGFDEVLDERRSPKLSDSVLANRFGQPPFPQNPFSG